MAKTKGKYQTSFTTYEDFKRIFNSIHSITGKNRLEWAKNLDPELLRIKNKNGCTVAHELADSGTLPEKFITDELLRTKTDYGRTVAHAIAWRGTLPERFITEELLRMEGKDGWTVAHSLAWSGTLPEKFFIPSILSAMSSQGETVAGCLLGWIRKNNRWDMLTPELLAAPYSKKLSVATFLRRKLTEMGTKDPERLESALGAMTTETKLALLKGSRGSAAAKKIRGDIDRETESEAFETPPDGEQDLHSGGQEELYCGVRSER